MAVDVKTLRIGSHVEYEGKRVRICSLKTNMANYDDGKGKPRCFGSNLAYYKRMHPIPITPELLEELGFEWRESSSCWRKEVGDDVWLFVNGKEEQGFRFNLFPPYEKGVQEPILYAKHLHEIEGQLAYYGVELIKE
jgi:hypothetical protein